FDLQSTSDQEDFRAYATVAAAAPMLVLPEQAANWAYPQPGMSDDDVVYTLSTAMLGRLYLSGWLNRLTGNQRNLVAQAVAAHKRLLGRMANCAPFWPLGLPAWKDEWVALGLRDETPGAACELHVTIWRRGDRPDRASLKLPELPSGRRWDVPRSVFPEKSPLSLALSQDGEALEVADDAGLYAARVVTL